MSICDGGTTRHQGYGISQSCRAMTECIFGWGKQHGTMRKIKHRGIAAVAADFLLNLIAYNLIRFPAISSAGAGAQPAPYRASPQRCPSAQHTGRNLARSGEHTGGGSLPHRHRDCATTKSDKLRAARGDIAGEALLGHEPGDADAALSPALEGFRPTPEFPEIEQAHRLLDAQPCRHGAQGEVR